MEREKRYQLEQRRKDKERMEAAQARAHDRYEKIQKLQATQERMYKKKQDEFRRHNEKMIKQERIVQLRKQKEKEQIGKAQRERADRAKKKLQNVMVQNQKRIEESRRDLD
eukprot:CAMPEP_0167770922 /NCGR_PEP_ID=MMETSP0110_2-20121227/18214_1 /TAXON_ID=629695 /ORGANISM="Gymnochlora sp., Strain CCMP2014" /LENGTH=110 /DNA_ID=CAMNT_0007660205 /DNA_START=115 /DNA_END=447 /DNA_ORIENTATION=+